MASVSRGSDALTWVIAREEDRAASVCSGRDRGAIVVDAMQDSVVPQAGHRSRARLAQPVVEASSCEGTAEHSRSAERGFLDHGLSPPARSFRDEVWGSGVLQDGLAAAEHEIGSAWLGTRAAPIGARQPAKRGLSRWDRHPPARRRRGTDSVIRRSIRPSPDLSTAARSALIAGIEAARATAQPLVTLQRRPP